MHTDRHTVVCTQSVYGVSDGDRGGRGWVAATVALISTMQIINSPKGC